MARTKNWRKSPHSWRQASGLTPCGGWTSGTRGLVPQLARVVEGNWLSPADRGVQGCKGFTVRSQIIWAKDRLVLSRGDYHWQHEPCWYAVKKTGKGHWAGDRKQTTLWQIANKDQNAATLHGTQKPDECMRRPILNNSSPGQAVFEPFMGSGTTLIAAETTGRVCFGVELNPAYVDVAIERWQAFTGTRATLAETGESFADLKAKRLGE